MRRVFCILLRLAEFGRLSIFASMSILNIQVLTVKEANLLVRSQNKNKYMKAFNIAAFMLFYLLLPVFLPAIEAQENTEGKAGISISGVSDSASLLMWAPKDNGRDINWEDAARYCADYKFGGYDDWRLPTLDELSTLYTKSNKTKDGYSIKSDVLISSCCVWSSNLNMRDPSIFSYKTGRKSIGFSKDSHKLRVLPVRDIKLSKH